MQELRNKVAVVTGAGSGIGEGLAQRLSKEGMNLVIADIEIDQAERVASDIRARRGKAIAVKTDVSNAGSVESLGDIAYAEFGAVHLLCNNAGVLVTREISEMSDSDWHWIIDVDLLGPINGLQAFLPRMLQQGGEAHIVNTASMAGVVPLLGMGLGGYTAAKYGVVGLSEILRSELAPRGIGVSVFSPMGVATNILTSERNRPGVLRSPTAPPEADRQTARARPNEQSPTNAQAPTMAPKQVAHVIVEGIRANRAYIFSHPEIAFAIQKRFAAMLKDCEQQWSVVEEARKF